MKDLYDAIKEAYSQSEPTPDAGGWQKVRASMRRASAVRSLAWAGGAIAACAACALLFIHTPAGSIDVVPATTAASAAALPAPVETLQADDAAVVPADAPDLVSQVRTKNAFPAGNDFPDRNDTVPVMEVDDADAEPTELQNVPRQDEVRTETVTRENYQPENWWEEEPAQKKKRRITVGLNASAAPVSSAVSNVYIPQTAFIAILKSNNFINNYAVAEIQSLYDNLSSTPTSVSYSHDIPLGLGLAVNIPLSERLSLETGLTYTYLHSVEDNNGLLSDQRLHFAGIPLRANFKLLQKKDFSIYAGAGASVEKCLKASVGTRSFNERRLQWSGEAFAGAEYNLWQNTSLYLQPTVSYWFTDTDLITYRTENPLVFSINAGLRFSL